MAVGAALAAGLALVLRATLEADWLYVVAIALLVVVGVAQVFGPWGRRAWVPLAWFGGVAFVAFIAQKLFG